MEIASVAGQAVQRTLTEAGTSASVPKPATEASPDAVAGLEKALNNQPEQARPEVGQDGRADAVDGPQEAAPGASLGERILGGLEKMSTSSRAAIEQARSAVTPQGEVSPGDLIKAQYALMQVSIQQDVTSKAAGKATQTLDTLLKNQ